MAAVSYTHLDVYKRQLWDDALAVAGFFHANQTRLEENSEKFANALFSSTVDPEVIDAAAGNILSLIHI